MPDIYNVYIWICPFVELYVSPIHNYMHGYIPEGYIVYTNPTHYISMVQLTCTMVLYSMTSKC